MDRAQSDALWGRLRTRFGAARHERMQALGHDRIEERREGSWVFDEQGKRYLDCDGSGGIFNLGRRPAEIVAEAKRALRETDQGNFPMVSWEKAELARRLADFTPSGLECTVFSVMRGEALDFACKLARGSTGRTQLLTVDGGWYGETGFALTLSDRPDRERFGPLIPDVGTIAFHDVSAACDAVTTRTAAVVVEVVQAENHARMLPEGMLEALRRRCDRVGALLVVDETQTGFGRTGRRFACEHASVVPDVLVLGEALGAGVFPIAATVFTQKVNAFLNSHPLIHLSTFGGSDLGCRVGLAALTVYERERPWVNAARAGSTIRQRLSEVVSQHGRAVSVRGQGLLLSLDLETAQRADRFCRVLSEHGVLASPGMVARRSVVLRPSLLIGDEEIETLVQAVDAALISNAASKV